MTRYRRVSRDANHGEIVDALKAVGGTVLDLSAVGGGCPDVAVGFRGVTYLIEIKNGDTKRGQQGKRGRETAERQRVWRESWRGGPVVQATAPDEALRVIGAVAG